MTFLSREYDRAAAPVYWPDVLAVPETFSALHLAKTNLRPPIDRLDQLKSLSIDTIAAKHGFIPYGQERLQAYKKACSCFQRLLPFLPEPSSAPLCVAGAMKGKTVQFVSKKPEQESESLDREEAKVSYLVFEALLNLPHAGLLKTNLPFGQNGKEEEKQVLWEEPPKVIEGLVNYLYTGRLAEKLSDEEVIKLYGIADRYNIEGLIPYCYQVASKDALVKHAPKQLQPLFGKLDQDLQAISQGDGDKMAKLIQGAKATKKL